VRSVAESKWEKFKRSFNKNFIDFLMIFAAEDRFIHQHKKRSSQIKELDRYGKEKTENENK
jgi:hypothetical protein